MVELMLQVHWVAARPLCSLLPLASATMLCCHHSATWCAMPSS
jgi:hypothetical protein